MGESDLTLLEFIMVGFSAILIVLLLRKMSKTGHSKFENHYRCTNNFRHIFPQHHINYRYGKNDNEVILCPEKGCGGVLKLFKVISDEDYKILTKMNYFNID